MFEYGKVRERANESGGNCAWQSVHVCASQDEGKVIFRRKKESRNKVQIWECIFPFPADTADPPILTQADISLRLEASTVPAVASAGHGISAMEGGKITLSLPLREDFIRAHMRSQEGQSQLRDALISEVKTLHPVAIV